MAQKVGQLVYEIVGDVSGLGASFARAENQAKKLGQTFQKELSLKTVASIAGVTAGLAALGGVLISSVEKATAFESRLGDLKTLTGENKKTVDDLREGILKLTRTIPKTADELGASAYDILSAGVTESADALKVLEASSKLAVAGLGDSKEAVGIVTSAINAFSISADEAGSIANTVFATVRAGKTTVSELSQSFGNVAAAARGAGVSFEEMQAATAALTLAGFRTATAQDRLRALFDEMTRSSGKLADSLKDAGIANVETAIKSDGFKKVLDKLLGSVGGNTVAFKNMFSSVEAGGAALALVTGVSKQYDETLDSILNSTNDLEKAFNEQANTTANKLVIAQNRMNELLIELGTRVLPILNSALEKTILLFDQISKFSDTVGNTGSEIEKLAAQGNLLTKELEKAKKGTSDFSKEQAQNAVRANILQLEITKLKERQSLLNDAMSGGVIASNKARNALSDLGIIGKRSAFEERDLKKAIEDTNTQLAEKTRKLEPLKSDLEKVLEPSRKLAAAQKDVGKALATTTQETDKAKKEMEEFQTKLLNLLDTAVDAREKLEKDLAGAFQKFGADLESQLSSTEEGLAKVVLGAEKEIADLQKRLGKEDDEETRRELEIRIAEQQKILEARKGFEERQATVLSDIRKKLEDANIDIAQTGIDKLLERQSLEEQIEEQRRLAALDEFSRFEELENQKLQKLVDNFIAEVNLARDKIEKQKSLEKDLTTFLASENKLRLADVELFAQQVIAKNNEVAASLRNLISLQTRLQSLQLQQSVPQFHEGGFVGPDGGQVHPGEFVIPAAMVSRFGGLVSALERARAGGSVVNRTVNAPISINARVDGEADFRAIGREFAWELGRL